MDSAHAIPAQGAINPDGSAAPVPSHRRLVDADLPKALDMSHHLNELAKHRQMSTLKELYRYMGIPGMITLAGGIPHPDVFPFEQISAQTLPVDHIPLDLPRTPTSSKKGLLAWLFGSDKKTDHFSIPKYITDAKPETIQLSTSLQYQTATGPPALPAFLREYVQRIYRPAYADWDVLINVGATDGWGKICNLLLEVGDAVLVEEWTYPGAENSFLPMQCEMVSVKMDGQGAIPEHLDQVLSEWDEAKRGKRRPRVFYTIPTGQNPSGATAMAERKQAIYKVAQKWDIIICEDEPYYCLYVGDWVPKGKIQNISTVQKEQLELEKQEGSKGNEAYVKALPPTYLTFDTDGRVIRMDTFSKTSCPGSRLGWITSSPIFIERLTRATEASTQAPSGFATALTTSMLQNWGMEGYIRWLRGIKSQYKQRRDWICDAFEDVFHIEVSSGGVGAQGNQRVMDVLGYGQGVTCYAPPKIGSSQAKWDEKRGMGSKVGKPLVSFIPPTAGMFIFLAVHLDSHPSYAALCGDAEADHILMDKIWHELADNKVLFAPGWGFDARGEHNIGGPGVGYFRLSYSVATYEQVRKAVGVLREVLVKMLAQEV